MSTWPKMTDDDFERDYVTVAECAKRMNISEEMVIEMIHGRALRATSFGGGMLVEPAIVSPRWNAGTDGGDSVRS